MTDEVKALVGKLRERAAKVREWIISSQRVVDLLAPEMEKFDKREAPWDTYTVRMSVDHQSSIRTQTKEVEEYEQAADLIETQAREIERLREAFLETREMLGLAEQVICEECCPTTWKTADGQPHSPLHEDIRAVLFKHEATRDEARAALGDSHE